MLQVRDITHQRLLNQQIHQPRFKTPGELVGWLGMVQAQDYLGALWALGLRLPGTGEADIERALSGRSIVRTWPARGTLHFAAAEDVRWLLALLSPGMLKRRERRHRELGLDEADFAHSHKVLGSALQGGRQLDRQALYAVLEEAGISTAGQRGIHILGRLALDGLLCFGARQGKQHTFTLLDEWLPPAEPLPRESALAELARRYFTSRGPAALQDFIWWSGLAAAEARQAVELVGAQLERDTVDGQAVWFAAPNLAAGGENPGAYLLPAFDEYLVAYRDRSAVLPERYEKHANAGGGILNPTLVLDGQVVGTWKRSLKKERVLIEADLFGELTLAEKHRLELAAAGYGRFLGLQASINYV